jgi:hypothetical protein
MKGARVVSAGTAILALATGSAAASSAAVNAAMGTLTTLIGVAVLWWVVGNMLTQHHYDAGGPKGGPIQKQ